MEFEERIDLIRQKLGGGCNLDMQERVDLLIRLDEYDKCIKDLAALWEIANSIATEDSMGIYEDGYRYCVFCRGEEDRLLDFRDYKHEENCIVLIIASIGGSE